ncbi:MAG: M67 family metallopeptidase, partial [Chloroflexota bacterium]|nr:M67 family metallopeptidase [Chloroflexota bacterium]
MLRLSHKHIQQLTDECRRAYPKEACGLLAGQNGQVAKVFPLTNVEHNPVGCAWRADSRQQFQAFQEIEREGWQLLAIYHSHPHSPAFPSPNDVKSALYPDALYLIVSLLDVERPDVRAFRIRDGR